MNILTADVTLIDRNTEFLGYPVCILTEGFKETFLTEQDSLIFMCSLDILIRC